MSTPLSVEEKKNAIALKNAGFSDREIVDLLKDNRSTNAEDGVFFGENSFGSRFKSGIKEATVGTYNDIKDRAERRGVVAAIERAPLSVAAGLGRGVGEIGYGAVETLDDLTGEIASDALAPVGQAIAESSVAEKAGDILFTLDQATDGAATDILDTLNLAGGAGLVRTMPAKMIAQTVKNSPKAAATQARRVADAAANPVDSLGDLIKGRRGGVIERTRTQFSDIDEATETAILRSNPEQVNQYFQQAKNAAADDKKSTPLEIVGNKAEEAFEINKTSITKASEAKKRILAESGDQQIEFSLADIKTSSLDKIGEKFGVDLSDIDDISQLDGRFSQLDNADGKLVSEYFTRLDSLGETPTLREVDDFVDWAQSQLYKQSTTFSKLEAANDPIVGQLKQVTGEINSSLKQGVGNGYSEVNARIKMLLELNEELNRGLGADARKGGGYVKQLFSPAGGNVRRVFADIEKETGIDLTTEARLAKFAMETVGDSRQKSLLQQLNVVTKEANQLDLAKPGTWLNFVRENIDLDGQELANALLRAQKRKEAEAAANGTKS